MNKYDKKHLKNLEALDRLIKRIMLKAAEDAARIGARIDELLDQEKLFSFDDYPSVKPEVEKLLKKLEEQLEVAIVNGVDSAWTLSNNKNDELSRRVFGDNVGELSQADYNRYFSNNNEAREAFKQRKTEGLNLSDRVWNCTKDFKAQIELGLNVGIRNGTSAVDMAQELKQWLVHPDKLFRKVRDEQGLLQLSENAKAFHPGRGVYRSSYMNARRLAATETNIAYRTADHLRWQQMDFVVGIEICLSNNHTIRLQPGETTDDPTQLRKDGTPKANAVRPLHDICDDLRGRYPKTFKFTGWHPHCRCYAVSILKTDEELAKDNERILNGEEPIEGSVNEVKDVPEGFKKWLEENEERIKGAKSIPYFMKDNVDYIPTQWRQSVLDAIDKKDYNGTNVSLKNSKIKIKGLPAVSDQEVIDTIKEVERVNPDLFRGGLKDVRIINTGKGFMANDRANGTNALNISNQDFKVGNNQTFNPLKELKDAFANIAKNKGNTVLTFNQEYALESLWHEIRHAQAVGWKDVANKTAELTNSMEVINQFCARKSYRSFVRSLGGNVAHEKKIMEKGYGYKQNVQNFCFILKKLKISQKNAYNYFKDIIVNKPYEDIHNEVVKFICKEGKMKIEVAQEIVAKMGYQHNEFNLLYNSMDV